MEENFVKIKSAEGKIVEFKHEICNLSKLLQMANPYEEIETDISFHTLETVKKFCEAHKYNEKSMQFKSPIKSDKLSDNIDAISFSILKDYYGITQEYQEKIKPLIFASYFLDFEKLRDIILITLGTPFYVGDTEAEIDSFKTTWGIGEITAEEERSIMENNKPVFDLINNVFSEQIKQQEEKYLESLQQKLA